MHNDASKEEVYEEGRPAEADNNRLPRKDGPKAEEDGLQRKDVPELNGLLRKDALEQDWSPKEDRPDVEEYGTPRKMGRLGVCVRRQGGRTVKEDGPLRRMGR